MPIFCMLISFTARSTQAMTVSADIQHVAVADRGFLYLVSPRIQKKSSRRLNPSQPVLYSNRTKAATTTKDVQQVATTGIDFCPVSPMDSTACVNLKS